MIVLDATSKSLEISAHSSAAFDVVVSYWSIDAAGLWTPQSYETAITGSGPTTILPAPASGVTKVVENIWIYIGTSGWSSSSQFVKIQLRTSPSVVRIIGWVEGTPSAFPGPNTVLVLKRDGSLIRNTAAMASGATPQVNQNIY